MYRRDFLRALALGTGAILIGKHWYQPGRGVIVPPNLSLSLPYDMGVGVQRLLVVAGHHATGVTYGGRPMRLMKRQGDVSLFVLYEHELPGRERQGEHMLEAQGPHPDVMMHAMSFAGVRQDQEFRQIEKDSTMHPPHWVGSVIGRGHAMENVSWGIDRPPTLVNAMSMRRQ